MNCELLFSVCSVLNNSLLKQTYENDFSSVLPEGDFWYPVLVTLMLCLWSIHSVFVEVLLCYTEHTHTHTHTHTEESALCYASLTWHYWQGITLLKQERAGGCLCLGVVWCGVVMWGLVFVCVYVMWCVVWCGVVWCESWWLFVSMWCVVWCCVVWCVV